VIALSEERESETIMKVLWVEGCGKVSIGSKQSQIATILWCILRLNYSVCESRWSCLLSMRSQICYEFLSCR